MASNLLAFWVWYFQGKIQIQCRGWFPFYVLCCPLATTAGNVNKWRRPASQKTSGTQCIACPLPRQCPHWPGLFLIEPRNLTCCFAPAVTLNPQEHATRFWAHYKGKPTPENASGIQLKRRPIAMRPSRKINPPLNGRVSDYTEAKCPPWETSLFYKFPAVYVHYISCYYIFGTSSSKA